MSFQINELRCCARCGKDHAKIVFKKLKRPAKDFQYWALCPTTQEPIVLQIREEDS